MTPTRWGFYSTRDSDWLERCDIGIEASGRWTLLGATRMNSYYITNPPAVSGLARNLAAGLFYDKVHEPRQGEKITIKVEDLNYESVGGYPTDPHVIYERLHPSACVQCLRLPADLKRSGKFRQCGRCHGVRYYSQGCQKEDWRVHKGLCQRVQPTEEEM